MMDGRVKTLHPALHGGILARRDRPDDLAAPRGARHRPGRRRRRQSVSVRARRRRIRRRRSTRWSRRSTSAGRRMVRAAAKNFRDVLVVVDPGRLRARCWRRSTPGPTPGVPLRSDAEGVRAHRGLRHRDRGARSTTVDARRRDASSAPAAGGVAGRRARTVARRRSATCATARTRTSRRRWYAGGVATRAAAVSARADVLQGKELSYTNLLDLDAAARIALEFDEPAAAVIKHTNPCGAAIGTSAADAYVRAREADRLAAFGGIVAPEPADRRRRPPRPSCRRSSRR